MLTHQGWFTAIYSLPMRGSRNFHERGSNENGNFWSQTRGVQPPKNPEITFFYVKFQNSRGGGGPDPRSPPLEPRMTSYSLPKVLSFTTSVVVLIVLCLSVFKMFVLLAPYVCYHILCPPNRRWGTYCFWCGSRPRPRSFFPTRYILNQLMVFDQTCIDAWLGGGKELIRFW